MALLCSSRLSCDPRALTINSRCLHLASLKSTKTREKEFYMDQCCSTGWPIILRILINNRQFFFRGVTGSLPYICRDIQEVIEVKADDASGSLLTVTCQLISGEGKLRKTIMIPSTIAYQSLICFFQSSSGTRLDAIFLLLFGLGFIFQSGSGFYEIWKALKL